VVINGSAVVSGVVYGDVVVVEGSATINGQVSGSVVAVDGDVRLLRGAQVVGDVIAGGTVQAHPAAEVGGRVREGVSYTLAGSASALGGLLAAISVGVSLLVLVAGIGLLAPTGAERVGQATSSAPLISFLWGVALVVLVPIVAVAALLTIVGLPLGVALALGLALLFLLGLAWGAVGLGRVIVRPPRSRWLALLVGWAIAAAVGLVPYLNVVAWSALTVMGLGASLVAMWRAGGRGGRHRRGYAPSQDPLGIEPPPLLEADGS
jgi:hypothetical protein